MISVGILVPNDTPLENTRVERFTFKQDFMNVISDWLKRWFSDPQAVALLVVLVSGFAIILVFGGYLAPVLASLVLAYLLEAPVSILEDKSVSRRWSSLAMSVALIVGFVLVSFALLPVLMRQASQFMVEIPQLVVQAQAYLMALPERYPSMFTPAQIEEILSALLDDVGSLRKFFVSNSLLVGVGVLYVGIYLILVPLLVFFFLKDKAQIQHWAMSFIPKGNTLLKHVWEEVDRQLANYVRGKFVEILVVWFFSYLIFAFLGLNYAILLSVLVGLSVLVPYLGALAVTFPVVFVAYAQWGLQADFVYVMVAYGILQALDGNILVPLLFSEAVDLHPVAIISAVLFFGGLWGFWGVFFAIPLATLVNAVLRAWPATARHMQAADPQS